MKVLVIEDGFEYSQNAQRFLGDHFCWTRAGHGGEALTKLSNEAFDCVLLDMCFDRVKVEELLGDVSELTSRFQGDTERAVAHLQRNQGNYILAHLRQNGCDVPVLVSYDFGAEPRRWEHLRTHFGPIEYIADNFDSQQLAAKLRSLC